MTDWHIAQLNVATALYPLDDERMAEFMGLLDSINALAENSPGFVWRLKSDQGDATDLKVTDDPKFIVNMSVWHSVEALSDFAYKSAHRMVMAKRRQWFVPPAGPYQGVMVGAGGRRADRVAGAAAAAPSRPAWAERVRLHLQAEIPAAGIRGAAGGHAAGALLRRLALAPSRHAAWPHSSRRRRSSANTASNIAGVNRPVFVL
jgi:Domain of unknown function (DUF3291)